jgi:glycosyltransferase involved in cell wall biosynthesis
MNTDPVHPPDLSIVVPFYNEEANIADLAAEVRQAVAAQHWHAEVIFVNDGSTDGTGAALDRIAANWPECRIVHFAANCGQAAALWHGLQQARAPIVATMDGDGQNVPADLAVLVPMLAQADVVVGWRKDRHDSWFRRLMSRTANHVRLRFLGDGLHDTGCALKVMRREVIACIVPVRTLYAFLPAMAIAAGFRVTERVVQHRPRRAGLPKYGFKVMWWRPMFDMVALKWVLARRIPRAVLRERTADGPPAG